VSVLDEAAVRKEAQAKRPVAASELQASYRKGERQFEDRNWAGQSFVGIEVAGAKFVRCNFAGADLGTANLEGAVFDQSTLSDARLVEANLTSTTFAAVDMSRADLTRTNLRRTKLDRSDLTEAQLDHADMTEASLIDSNLTRASLIRTKLEGTGIEDTHMPGANLSGATGPGVQEKLKARLEVAKGRADGLRPVFIGAVGVFGYIGITVLGTKDALILTNLATMDLPIVSAKVPVQAFFLAAGFVCLSILAFILAQVGYFARMAARLPARLPEGPALRELVDPWVLNSIGIQRRPDLPLWGDSQLTNVVRRTFELFGSWLPGFLIRWTGCLVLWLLMVRFLIACGPRSFVFVALVAMFLLSWIIAFGLVSYAELIEGTRPRSRWQRHGQFAALSMVLAFFLRWILSVPPFHRGVPGDDLQRAALVDTNLQSWNFAGCNLEQASLSHSNLSGAFLQEAHLGGADLRHTRMDGASLAGAALGRASLALSRGSQPNFWNADLDDADLRMADFRGAILQYARLRGARLQHARLIDALAAGADFGKWENKSTSLNDANFDGAWLGGAIFSDAVAHRSSFVAADLVSANFENAFFGGANFTRANLSYAAMSSAHVEGARFDHALLQSTVLHGAFTWHTQFPQARIRDVEFGGNLATSNFDGARLARVEFKGADLFQASFRSARLCHVKLSGNNVSGIVFDHAILHDVDLSGQNLTEAHFEGATLVDVKLDGAIMEKAHFDGATFRRVHAKDVLELKLPPEASAIAANGEEINGPGADPTAPFATDNCKNWTEQPE
jgi:uncharacterized protein YjbI with pentapeptide repeats